MYLFFVFQLLAEMAILVFHSSIYLLYTISIRLSNDTLTQINTSPHFLLTNYEPPLTVIYL
jgi:hypothetical protein